MTRSPVALALAALVGLSAWASLGTLAVAGAQPGAPRVGILPPWWALAVLVASAITAISSLDRRGFPRIPWLIASLTLLPWLPTPVPAAFLIWCGPIVWLVWAAVAVGVVAGRRRGGRPTPPAALTDPGRAPVTAAVAGAIVFGAAAWFAAPSVPGGDEPHYLIITQSLLRDRDLTIEDNHARREYAEYLALPDLKPDFLQRGADGEIYSIHAPGLPVVVAPAFAVGGYRGVKVFLILLSALGAALVWRAAWRATGEAGAAWFGWAAVCLSPTWVFHTFTVYPDGPAAILALVGVCALIRLGALDAAEPVPGVRALAISGAALAALPWLHTRFALVAAALGFCILGRLARRLPWRAAMGAVAAFLAAPVASAIAWLGFFHAIYGTPDPRAPYGGGRFGAWEYVTSGLGGLFFDQQFGLLPYAPALAAGLLGLVILAVDRRTRRFAFELVLVMTPYLLAVTHFRMWWAGWSAPARFFTVLLLPLAIPAAVTWKRAARPASRAVLAWTAALTAVTTMTLAVVDGGRLAYNVRDGFALGLEWLARLADLPRALPSFHRTPEGQAFVHVLTWLAGVTLAWAALSLVERWKGARSRVLIGAAPLALAAAVMGASTAVWRSNDATGLTPTPAQLALLRRAAGGPGVAVVYGPGGNLEVADVPGRLVIESEPRYLQSRDRPLFVLPGLPAGHYRLRVSTGAAAAGTLDLGIAREPFALQRAALADVASAGGAVEIRHPVAVRALVVRGDEAARASVTRLALEPVSLLSAAARASPGVATRAVAYPGGTVYFMDDGAFAEPDAFWVRGAGEAEVVVQPPATAAGARPSIDLFLRNAPVENRVSLVAGRWRTEITLAPREERTVAIPLASGPAALGVRLATTAGFRPSMVEPGSLDDRFLGVWVEVR